MIQKKIYKACFSYEQTGSNTMWTVEGAKHEFWTVIKIYINIQILPFFILSHYKEYL